MPTPNHNSTQDHGNEGHTQKWYEKPSGFLLIAVFVIVATGCAMFFFGWRV